MKQVFQGCQFYPVLLSFFTDMLLVKILLSSHFSGVSLLPRDSLVLLEFTDDIFYLGQESDKMQNLLNTLSNNGSRLGIPSVSLKCKMLLQDWLASALESMIGSEVIEYVDHFSCLGSLTSPHVVVSDEISARILKVRFAFAKLHHWWNRRDINLLTEGRVCYASACSVLLYECEAWVSRMDDICRLLVFDPRCVGRGAHIF